MSTPSIPEPLDQYDNALVQYLKRTQHPTLDGVIAVYANRCAIDHDYAALHIAHIAEWAFKLWRRVEPEADMLIFIEDATPANDWRFLDWLLTSRQHHTEEPNRLYWQRILSVACSRLYMMEVAKLPGYNHDAAPLT